MESTIKDFLGNLPNHIERVSAQSYEENTLGIAQKVRAAIRPKNSQEIKDSLRVAQKYKARLHPISTGKNWGYGSALGPDPEAVILDLSLFKEIRFNPIEETFSIGPGVTQSDLHQFLISRNLDYLVPITGAGPSVSILANALERGYGITPIEDHFASVVGMKAILADGSEYIPIMTEKTGLSLWKWDIGPFLQGLFTQSSFGIVTELTVRLFPKPDFIGIFKASSDDLSGLVAAAKEARKIELVKGINLMNELRITGMTGKAPKPRHWTLIGSFYCRKELLSGMKRSLSKIFKKNRISLQIVDNHAFKYLGGILKAINPKEFMLANGFFNALKGIPTTLALNLVGGEENVNKNGLIWYSPIVPNHPDTVHSVSQFIVKTCEKYSIKPLITYTLVQPNAFDATIPILFSKTDNRDAAWACYDELLQGGIKLGIIPYRFPVNRMDIVKGTSADRLNMLLKQALDPNQILSENRYVSKD